MNYRTKFSINDQPWNSIPGSVVMNLNNRAIGADNTKQAVKRKTKMKPHWSIVFRLPARYLRRWRVGPDGNWMRLKRPFHDIRLKMLAVSRNLGCCATCCRCSYIVVPGPCGRVQRRQKGVGNFPY